MADGSKLTTLIQIVVTIAFESSGLGQGKSKEHHSNNV
jgi:hypothetical protein